MAVFYVGALHSVIGHFTNLRHPRHFERPLIFRIDLQDRNFFQRKFDEHSHTCHLPHFGKRNYSKRPVSDRAPPRQSLSWQVGNRPWAGGHQRPSHQSAATDGKEILNRTQFGLACDFTGGALGHRLHTSGRRQALARAAGFDRGRTPSVVDATAGLGRDAFLLASLGANVALVERSMEIHSLLKDGLLRATNNGGKTAEAAARMTLHLGDAKTLLPKLAPEIVLVDPMHPPRTKSALVKKEMRLLREIVGTDEDALDLMHVALAAATKRVVLKWPLRAPAMAGLVLPSHQIRGKTTRYDVFMTG